MRWKDATRAKEAPKRARSIMATILLVPGIDGGGEGHWLSWVEAEIPDSRRFTPPDPNSPDLAEWSAALCWDLQRCDAPVFLVAHGFGCLVAVRAASECPHLIEGAVLVAPADPDNLRLAWMLPEEPLGFPASIVASTNDPHMRLSKAAFWANFWSCGFVNAGRVGSLDAKSGFGPWPGALTVIEEARQSPPQMMRAGVGREASNLSRAI
jgi:uncharacterized protein